MRVNKTLKFLLLACVIIMSQSAFAQEEGGETKSEDPTKKTNFNKLQAGIHFGHTVPYTDIRQFDYFPVFKYKNENSFGAGAFLSYNISNAIALQGKFSYANLRGTRRGAKIGNVYPSGVYFSTNVINYGLNLVFNLTQVTFSPNKAGKSRRYGIYLFFGHGLMHFKTQAKTLIGDNELKNYRAGHSGKNEDDNTLVLVSEANNPLGAGFKYKLSNQIDLGLELVINRGNTDKLDGFVVGNSPDYWGQTSITVAYKFGSAGKDEDHLEWVNPMEAMYSDIQENKERINALSKDTDNDGVADIFDKDSNTPEGIKVDGSGVALDSDRDGVADSEDEDPFTDIGAAVDDKGKAIDSDGDGVPDNRDLEANSEKGALVNFQGKTIGDIAGGGGGGGGIIGEGGAVLPSVFFDLNGSTVKYANYDRLATIARAMKANPGVKIKLIGNTDVSGSEEYNKGLGEKRAQAVADHLTKHYGIEADRFMVESKGESDPLATGQNHVNRRVDAVVN